MMLFPSAIVICASICLANGYMIDKISCSNDKYQFAKDTAEQALNMAHKIGASIEGATTTPNAERLLKLLFNVDDAAVGRKLISDTIVAGKPNNKGYITGLLVYQEEKFDVKILDKKNELVIFCNSNRLEVIEDKPDKLFDPINAVAVPKKDPCSDKLPVPTFMYTTFFDGNHFDTITFCPWFLEYAMKEKYRSKKDYLSFLSFLASSGLDKLLTKILYTPIDLLSLWDKTMLHEMMHTTAAGRKDDVGGYGGYGWKNCKTLALDTNSNLAKTNADSWALFGSALWFLDMGYTVLDNGNFRENPRGDRKRWSGSGAVRGLDIVRREAAKQLISDSEPMSPISNPLILA